MLITTLTASSLNSGVTPCELSTNRGQGPVSIAEVGRSNCCDLERALTAHAPSPFWGRCVLHLERLVGCIVTGMSELCSMTGGTMRVLLQGSGPSAAGMVACDHFYDRCSA